MWSDSVYLEHSYSDVSSLYAIQILSCESEVGNKMIIDVSTVSEEFC